MSIIGESTIEMKLRNISTIQLNFMKIVAHIYINKSDHNNVIKSSSCSFLISISRNPQHRHHSLPTAAAAFEFLKSIVPITQVLSLTTKHELSRIEHEGIHLKIQFSAQRIAKRVNSSVEDTVSDYRVG
jgi:hypothetical protein